MKTILCLTILLLGLAPIVRAQGPVFAGWAPVFEAGAGYSYLGTSIPSNGSSLGMSGILLSGNADFSRRFGVKVEAGYSRAFNAFQTGHSADMLTYMGGPVYYPYRHRKLNLYEDILFGGARETGVNTTNQGGLLLGYTNRFAWTLGVGAEYRILPSLSLRLGGDYLRTAFYNSNVQLQGQNNIRTELSLIYTFGNHE
jgi:opacity protein-like surface antigen